METITKVMLTVTHIPYMLLATVLIIGLLMFRRKLRNLNRMLNGGKIDD